MDGFPVQHAFLHRFHGTGKSIKSFHFYFLIASPSPLKIRQRCNPEGITVIAEPAVSGWLNKTFVKPLIDLRPLFQASLLDLWGKPFSICKAICIYLTVPDEALRAVPNTSIFCFGSGAPLRWECFLTKVMLMLLECSCPHPGTVGTEMSTCTAASLASGSAALCTQ